MTLVSVDIPKNGRIVIPVEVRQDLGLQNGGTLIFSKENGITRVLSRQQMWEEVRAELGPLLKNSSVDDFIAGRRAEAAKEEAEFAEHERLAGLGND